MKSEVLSVKEKIGYGMGDETPPATLFSIT